MIIGPDRGDRLRPAITICTLRIDAAILLLQHAFRANDVARRVDRAVATIERLGPTRVHILNGVCEIIDKGLFSLTVFLCRNRSLRVTVVARSQAIPVIGDVRPLTAPVDIELHLTNDVIAFDDR